MSDLTTLRAEVEALRDDALKRREQAAEAVAAYWNRPGDYWAADQVRRYQYEGTTYNAQKDAYQTILDLIDKHAREGQ